MDMRMRFVRCSSASSFLLQTDLSIQSFRYSASSTALWSELGGRLSSIRLTDSCLQSAPKKRPSPLQSISGWESRIRISHVVPDFCWPRTKNTGVLTAFALGGRPSPRASSLLSAAISPSSTAICLRAPLLVFDRKAFAAAFRDAFAPRSVSKTLRLPKIVNQDHPPCRDARRDLAKH